MHARQQIRNQVKTTLTGLTTTGANVFANRVFEYDKAAMPSLNILTNTDKVELDMRASGGKDLHDLELIIEVRVKASASVDDTIDTICAEVETAIFGSNDLNGLAERIDLIDTQIGIDAETEKKTGIAAMSFSVLYRYVMSDPTTIIA